MHKTVVAKTTYENTSQQQGNSGSPLASAINNSGNIYAYSNFEYTYYPDVFFAILRTSLALVFNYCRCSSYDRTIKTNLTFISVCNLTDFKYLYDISVKEIQLLYLKLFFFRFSI
jgi:hypothetical protein